MKKRRYVHRMSDFRGIFNFIKKLESDRIVNACVVVLPPSSGASQLINWLVNEEDFYVMDKPTTCKIAELEEDCKFVTLYTTMRIKVRPKQFLVMEIPRLGAPYYIESESGAEIVVYEPQESLLPKRSMDRVV